MSARAAVRAVLVDLDGTLLDTAPDLAAAANRMLGELCLPARPAGEISEFVGQGIARLVQRCLWGEHGGTRDAALLERASAIFARCYDEESGSRTRIYPGVKEGLRQLRSQGLAIACVTNKIARFTLPLLERMDLAGSFDAVICGDMVPRLKPDPAPYLHACGRLGVGPPDAVVIGDSASDVIAARAAGCRVVCVSYGYKQGLPAASLACDALVDDLRAAAGYVRDLNRMDAEAAR